MRKNIFTCTGKFIGTLFYEPAEQNYRKIA